MGPIHLVAPSDCKSTSLLKLLVVAYTVEQQAPNWQRHAQVAGCPSFGIAGGELGKQLSAQFVPLRRMFNLTLHSAPSDRLASSFGFMFKPWLVGIFAESTPLAPSATVIIVDTDEFLWTVSLGSPIAPPHPPVAQRYAFGSKWVGTVCEGSTADICPASLQKDRREARLHYMLGVPYVLNAADFRAIGSRWFHFMRRVTERKREFGIMCDQYAYSLAAHAAGLPHTQSARLMISDTSGAGEGWGVIEELPPVPCSQLASGNWAKMAAGGLGITGGAAPLFLHACQVYNACADGSEPPKRWRINEDGPCPRSQQWFFAKRQVPAELMSGNCDAPLLIQPPPERLFSAQTSSLGKRHAFMVCALTHMYNNALRSQCPLSKVPLEQSTCVRPTRNSKSSRLWEARHPCVRV